MMASRAALAVLALMAFCPAAEARRNGGPLKPLLELIETVEAPGGGRLDSIQLDHAILLH